MPVGPDGKDSLPLGSEEGTNTIQVPDMPPQTPNESTPAADPSISCGHSSERREAGSPTDHHSNTKRDLAQKPLPFPLPLPMLPPPPAQKAASLLLPVSGDEADWVVQAALCRASAPTGVERDETLTPPSIQEERAKPQDQEEDDQGSIEPADLLAPAVPRQELLQFLDSMRHSRKKVQLTLKCWGVDFHQVLNLVRALVGEGREHKESHDKNYHWA